MPLAYWILNYKKYDTAYNPSDWDIVFRNNILIVTDENIDAFMAVIKPDKVHPSELTQNEIAGMNFYIDFDDSALVSSFSNIEVEDYLSPGSWRSSFDNPLNYLPWLQ
jgi:hypothetical protein